MPWFDDETYEFLGDLADNNERAWFEEHKPRYEAHVKDAALGFITALQEPMAAISPHFPPIAKTQGGSLFRIYRDTRFAKDKTPYKTHLGVHIRHARAKDAHAPGFYLHVEPAASMFGAGIWHPDPAALALIRGAIDARPAEWIVAKAAIEASSLELGGESSSRMPRGFDKDHALAEDLKRKDFIAFRSLTEAETMTDDFDARFVALCAEALPLQRFLCGALGVEI